MMLRLLWLLLKNYCNSIAIVNNRFVNINQYQYLPIIDNNYWWQYWLPMTDIFWISYEKKSYMIIIWKKVTYSYDNPRYLVSYFGIFLLPNTRNHSTCSPLLTLPTSISLYILILKEYIISYSNNIKSLSSFSPINTLMTVAIFWIWTLTIIFIST